MKKVQIKPVHARRHVKPQLMPHNIKKKIGHIYKLSASQMVILEKIVTSFLLVRTMLQISFI